MAKSREAFRTISEVAEWLETPAHVLRFWESKFTQVKPVKRAGGRRYYRPGDMELLGGIKKLLHEDGMTIKGVQKVLREHGIKHVAALAPPLDADEDAVTIEDAPFADVADTTDSVVAFDRGTPETSPAAEEPEEVTPEPEPPATTEPEPMAEAAPPDVTEEPAEPDASPPVEDVAPPVAAENAAPAPAPDVETSEPEPPVVETATAETDATETPPAAGIPDFLTKSLADWSEPAGIVPPDLPADPDPSDLEVPPGPLELLARIDALDADLAQRMRQPVDALRAVHVRLTSHAQR